MSVGFKWGPLSVVRLCDDEKHGAWIEVYGERERIEIRVTKGGRLRVGPVIKRRETVRRTDNLEVIE